MSLHIRQTPPSRLSVRGALLWIALICLIMGLRGRIRGQCAFPDLVATAADRDQRASITAERLSKLKCDFWPEMIGITPLLN